MECIKCDDFDEESMQTLQPNMHELKSQPYLPHHLEKKALKSNLVYKLQKQDPT